jgi:hypothetical protein
MILGLVHRDKSRVNNEPIEIKERRYGFVPQSFLWHGRRYRVHAVERCWSVGKRRWDGGRLCFLLRCAEGTFEVHQNLATNTWHVTKARWHAGERARRCSD